MTKRFLLGLSGLFLSVCSFSQLSVENTETVAWYVEQVLLGGGVEVSNITFNGLSADQVSLQLGYFGSYNANVGIPTGMVLTTGESQGAIGPNNTSSSTTPDMGLGLPGDMDLDQFTAFGTFDAAVLEFDFIPNGDSLSFDYVFASEEYPEFANDIYNDIFGFFLSGPGITGPYSSPAGFPGGSVNIATLPGSGIAVSINNINNGQDNTGPCEQCEYYLYNGDGFEAPYESDPFYIQYDGLTTVLTALAEVECGSTYHIKIALADAGDNGYDSAVFLREGSFETNQSVELDLSFEFPTPYGPDVVIEGCYTGTISLERFENIDEEEVIPVTYSGTAINGVDYEPLPTQVTFPAGAAVVELDLIAIADGLAEGTETLIIQFNEVICGEALQNASEFSILDDAGPLNLPQTSYAIDCNETLTIGATASGGIGLYNYSWESGENDSFIEVSPLVTSGYTLTVTDTCVAEPFEITYLVEVAEYPEVQVLLPEDIFLECLEESIEISPLISEGGNGNLEYQWMVDGLLAGNGPELNWATNEDIDISLTLTDGCGESATDIMSVAYEPYTSLELSLPDNVVLDCLNPTAVLSPLLSGGQGPLTLEWSQDGSSLGNLNEVEVGTEDNSTILLTVTDECSFSAEGTVILNYSIAPDIQVELGEDVSLLCNDPEVTLGPLSVTGGQGPLSFSWSADGSMISIGAELSTLVPDEETFTLTATDGCGHEGSDDITVMLAPYSPPSAFLLGDSDGCPGDMASLYAMADEGMEPYSYFWPHNGASSEVTVDHPESSRSYSVQVTDACGNTTEAFTEIIVSPISASFFLEETDYYGFESSNSSFSSEEDSLSYFWYVDGLLVSEQMNHGMAFTDLDNHSVSMVVVNSAGCRDSIWTDLSPPSSIYIPSGFSPDGDGVNDFFKVYHHDLQSFSIDIFDRWGTKVYSSEDPDRTWNGGFQGDGEYHSGSTVYVYQVQAQGADGRYFDLRGEVTIVR